MVRYTSYDYSLLDGCTPHQYIFNDFYNKFKSDLLKGHATCDRHVLKKESKVNCILSNSQAWPTFLNIICKKDKQTMSKASNKVDLKNP